MGNSIQLKQEMKGKVHLSVPKTVAVSLKTISSDLNRSEISGSNISEKKNLTEYLMSLNLLQVLDSPGEVRNKLVKWKTKQITIIAKKND